MKKIIEQAGARSMVNKIGDTAQWVLDDPSGESGLDASMVWDEEGSLSMLVSEWIRGGKKNGRSREDAFRVVIDPDGRIEDYKGEQDGPSSLSAAREFRSIISRMNYTGVNR